MRRGREEDDGDYAADWDQNNSDDDGGGADYVHHREEDEPIPKTSKEIQRMTEERAQLVPYMEVSGHIRNARRMENVAEDARWRYAFYSGICRYYLSATKGIKLPIIEREGEERRVSTPRYDFK